MGVNVENTADPSRISYRRVLKIGSIQCCIGLPLNNPTIGCRGATSLSSTTPTPGCKEMGAEFGGYY